MKKTNSYVEMCKEWDAFLAANPLHFVTIKKGERNNVRAKYLKGEYPNTTTRIYFSDVRQSHANFQEYFDSKIVSEQLKLVTIYPKKRNGSSSKPAQKEMGFYDVEFRFKELVNSREKKPEVTQKTTMEPGKENQHQNQSFAPPVLPVHVPAPPVHSPAPYYPPQAPIGHGLGAQALQNIGGLGAAAAAAGMGFNELSELKATEKMYRQLVEDHASLRKKADILEIDNRTLQGKVEVSEQQKQVALQLEQADKRGFFDSPAGQKMMESLPALFDMIGNKVGGGQNAPGLASPAGASEVKNQFVSYLNDPMITDEMVNLLGASMFLMTENLTFLPALNNLNQQYATENPSN